MKTSAGQNGVSYVGPAVVSRIPNILQNTETFNTFKHNIKFYYLDIVSKTSCILLV